MNADEMMYELGFKKVNLCSFEVILTYRCLTENDRWAVYFFKWYGVVHYMVSYSHRFETDGEWKTMDAKVDMDLHKAIHQVLLEHGWL